LVAAPDGIGVFLDAHTSLCITWSGRWNYLALSRVFAFCAELMRMPLDWDAADVQRRAGKSWKVKLRRERLFGSLPPAIPAALYEASLPSHDSTE
jgi:hypothetical protein